MKKNNKQTSEYIKNLNKLFSGYNKFEIFEVDENENQLPEGQVILQYKDGSQIINFNFTLKDKAKNTYTGSIYGNEITLAFSSQDRYMILSEEFSKEIANNKSLDITEDQYLKNEKEFDDIIDSKGYPEFAFGKKITAAAICELIQKELKSSGKATKHQEPTTQTQFESAADRAKTRKRKETDFFNPEASTIHTHKKRKLNSTTTTTGEDISQPDGSNNKNNNVEFSDNSVEYKDFHFISTKDPKSEKSFHTLRYIAKGIDIEFELIKNRGNTYTATIGETEVTIKQKPSSTAGFTFTSHTVKEVIQAINFDLMTSLGFKQKNNIIKLNYRNLEYVFEQDPNNHAHYKRKIGDQTVIISTNQEEIKTTTEKLFGNSDKANLVKFVFINDLYEVFAKMKHANNSRKLSKLDYEEEGNFAVDGAPQTPSTPKTPATPHSNTSTAPATPISSFNQPAKKTVRFADVPPKETEEFPVDLFEPAEQVRPGLATKNSHGNTKKKTDSNIDFKNPQRQAAGIRLPNTTPQHYSSTDSSSSDDSGSENEQDIKSNGFTTANTHQAPKSFVFNGPGSLINPNATQNITFVDKLSTTSKPSLNEEDASKDTKKPKKPIDFGEYKYFKVYDNEQRTGTEFRNLRSKEIIVTYTNGDIDTNFSFNVGYLVSQPSKFNRYLTNYIGNIYGKEVEIVISEKKIIDIINKECNLKMTISLAIDRSHMPDFAFVNTTAKEVSDHILSQQNKTSQVAATTTTTTTTTTTSVNLKNNNQQQTSAIYHQPATLDSQYMDPNNTATTTSVNLNTNNQPQTYAFYPQSRASYSQYMDPNNTGWNFNNFSPYASPHALQSANMAQNYTGWNFNNFPLYASPHALQSANMAQNYTGWNLDTNNQPQTYAPPQSFASQSTNMAQNYTGWNFNNFHQPQTYALPQPFASQSTNMANFDKLTKLEIEKYKTKIDITRTKLANNPYSVETEIELVDLELELANIQHKNNPVLLNLALEALQPRKVSLLDKAIEQEKARQPNSSVANPALLQQQNLSQSRQ